MSVREGTESFTVDGGHALLHRSWRDVHDERVLAIVHGVAEHSERYRHVGAFFAGRGWAVHAYDQRGHGESGGPRNFTPSFDALLDDLEHFLSRVQETHPGRPVAILGHSMGGLVVASHLIRRKSPVAAAVLSGPALAPGRSIPGWQIAVGRVLGRVAPRLPLPLAIDADALSRDPEVGRAYLADPRIDPRPRAGLGRAVFEEMSAIGGRAAEIAVPLLIVHGEDDPLVPVEGSRRFAEGLRGSGSGLRTYPGLRHEVLNEPERDRVLEDIARWLDARTDAGVAS